MPSSLPIYKVKSNGVWGGDVELDNVNFNNFESKTKCGGKQVLMKRNPAASDFIPMHKFKNTSFRDVEEAAMVWIEDPDPGWANPTDCGIRTCTAPNNVVLKFTGSTYSGTSSPLRAVKDF